MTENKAGRATRFAAPTGSGRPGLWWRVGGVFVAVSLAWVIVVHGTGPFFGPAHSDRLGHAVRAVAVSALVLPLVLLARRRLDRRPWEGLGPGSLRDGWRQFLFGMAFWFAAAGVGLAVALGPGWVWVSFGATGAGLVLLALYLPLLVLLYEALPEELVFRGYFYRNLADRHARWAAVVAQAALFTLFGVLVGAAGSADRVVLFFTFGIVLGVLRAVTGGLWASIGFHLAFQWVTQLVAAAVREGSVRMEGQDVLNVVAFWFFPILLGSVVLVAASVLRGCAEWREREPDTPQGSLTGTAAKTSRRSS